MQFLLGLSGPAPDLPAGGNLASHLFDHGFLYAVALYLILLAFKAAVKRAHTARVVAIALGLVTIPAAALLLGRPPALEQGGAVRYAWAALWISIVYIAGAIVVGVVSGRLARKRPDPIPALQRTLLIGMITIAGAAVVFLLLEINLSGLFAGVAVSSLVIGFALQKTLSNLFSGLALDLDRSVRQGDWIQLSGSGLVARVADKSMRVTRLLTIDNEQVTVPNNTLAAETIYNLSQPDSLVVRRLRVGASYKDPPVKVKDVLRQVLRSDPEILMNPLPSVRVETYGDFSIEYVIKYWIRDYGRSQDVDDRVMTGIWYAFRQNGIEIPFPIRTVHHKTPSVLRAEEREVAGREEKARASLASLGFLRDLLSESEIAALARDSVFEQHLPGETIVERGGRTDNLYVVIEGRAVVDIPGKEKPVLESESFFGEMALLAGEARTATIRSGPEGCGLLRLDRESMGRLFTRHPELRRVFESARTQRREDLRERGALPLGTPTGRRRLSAGQWLVRGIRALLPW